MNQATERECRLFGYLMDQLLFEPARRGWDSAKWPEASGFDRQAYIIYMFLMTLEDHMNELAYFLS